MTPVHVHLQEWQTVGPEIAQLRGIHLGGDAPRELARRLRKAGVVEVTELRNGVQVRARAHVGESNSETS